MTGSDDEFEDFLNRRKSVFRRPPDEMFEPPAELDRVVLRQAREAIKPPEPMRVFSAPRWSMPLGLAATLVLAFTIIFRAGMPPPTRAPLPEVTAQAVVERVDAPTAAAAPPPQEVIASSGTGDVNLEKSAQAAPAPPAEPVLARSMADAASREHRSAGAAGSTMDAPAASAPPAKANEVAAWRRDPKSWQTEIQRLRDAGDTARADAEAAEFKRQQRAFAVSPDR